MIDLLGLAIAIAPVQVDCPMPAIGDTDRVAEATLANNSLSRGFMISLL
jgi:hypothetical protein